MYEQFYGLTERPFSLTPNPKYVFYSDRYRTALDELSAATRELEDMQQAEGVDPEYLELLSAHDLSPAERVNGNTLLAVAARVGPTMVSSVRVSSSSVRSFARVLRSLAVAVSASTARVRPIPKM